MNEGSQREGTRLVRMTIELIDAITDKEVNKVDWGKPVEYVVSDDHGKQYLEPVYSPTIYINDINDPKVRA